MNYESTASAYIYSTCRAYRCENVQYPNQDGLYSCAVQKARIVKHKLEREGCELAVVNGEKGTLHPRRGFIPLSELE